MYPLHKSGQIHRTLKLESPFRFSRMGLVFGLALTFVAARPVVASATNITVYSAIDVPFIGGPCDLRQAIESHNREKSPIGSGCSKGSGNDVILLKPHTIDLGSPLPPINGTLKIRPENDNVCYNLRQAAYLKVAPGANVTLQGISVIVNGAEHLSVLDNDGGTLNINANGSSGGCDYSNQNGRAARTLMGGVLNNRNNGTTFINAANFINSSAGERGGAIYIDSGSVNIQGGTFSNNHAPNGGAIFVGSIGTLNITSSNFSIRNNTASVAGGAINMDGGTLIIQRNSAQKLGNVSIADNTAPMGTAIFDDAGALSIDGVQFLHNGATDSGGVIRLTHVIPYYLGKPASITNSYFDGKRLAIYLEDRSALNLSGDTFAGWGLPFTFSGAAIEVDGGGILNVINSTFLGDSAFPQGIAVLNGSAKVSFSTIARSVLRGVSVSNSLLSHVTCTSITDGGGNLQEQTKGCPSTIINEPDLGLSKALLQDNGGPTPTIALETGSPAIGKIPIGDCLDLSDNALKIDQRGFGRPGPDGSCSIGAYEFGASPTGPGIGGIPPGTRGLSGQPLHARNVQ